MKAKYCSNCGAKITVGAGFCSECGSKIERTEEKSLSTKDVVNSNSESIYKEESTSLEKKKKGGVLRTLGKVALWTLGILIVATTILYFMGDEPDTLSGGNHNITEDLKVNDLVSVAKTIVPEPFDVIKNSISSEGGVISDDEIELHVPAGALQNNERIIVKKIHGQLPIGESDSGEALAEAIPISTAYDFGPDGILFQKPVTVTLKYDEKAIPEGMDEKNVVMLYFDGQKWMKVDGKQNEKNNTISASVNGFPGSLITTVGTAILVSVAAVAYKLNVPAKVKQLLYDPIENNEVHKVIKIDNPLVKKYANKIAILTPGGTRKQISFDDPKALAEFIKSSKKFQWDIGFKKKYGNLYTSLNGKYVSNKHTLEPVENYLNRIERNEDKFGDCIEVANALVSILRAKGYDIKGVSGYSEGKPHAWAEITIGEEVYGIDPNGLMRKLPAHMKHVTRAKVGHPYRKEWDEKGTRPYGPTLIIVPPSGDISVDDNKRYTFHLKTFNLSKDAMFRWNLNNGGGGKSKNKSRSFTFPATGKKSLVVTAYWNGQEWSKTYNFNVLGVDQKKEGISQASKSSTPDKIDTKDVDGIVEIDDDTETKTGHWVLYDIKVINGCKFYDSECWPLEDCSGGEGSFHIAIGSSTCGSNAAGSSGSGTYTVPPSTLVPGEKYTFKATAEGKGYTSIHISYYSNKEKMAIDEKGHNTGDSSTWNERIVKNKNSPGVYTIPIDMNKGGALLIAAGGSIGSFETSRHYYYFYQWEE
jgi:hypothetical protein